MALRYELIDALKRLLKGRGMTYAQLATKIDLSEASVKRMFSQQTMTLARLDEICEALGIGLTELVEHARPEHEPLSALSEEQEEELVSDPRLFLTLYLALNRWRENGPVMRLFAKKLIPEFFARPFAGENEQILLLAGMVSRPTGQLLKQRLQELAREFDALMARDSVLPVAERVGLSLVLGVRPWGLPDFEKFRRKNDTTPA